MRDARRRARADPNPVTAAEALRDDLRRGLIDPAPLRLAGQWGHPVARLLFPENAVEDHEAALEAGAAFLDADQRRRFACDCAERALWIFEDKTNDPPQDLRPRHALELLRRRRYPSGLLRAINDDYNGRMDSTTWAALAVEFAAQNHRRLTDCIGAAWYASQVSAAPSIAEEQAWQRRRLAELLFDAALTPSPERASP